MRNLTTPIVETNSANTVEITAFTDNREDGRIEISYMIFLEDGTPFRRSHIILEGDDVPAFYASLGVDFESQVKDVLYDKILADLG
jgi:hypothetical protein